MSIPNMIRAMRAAGISPEQILNTVEALEEERLAKGRARVAKCRNNKRERNVTHVTSVTPVTQKERSPQTPLKEKYNNPPVCSLRSQTSPHRGEPLPPDWEPSKENYAWAGKQGYPGAFIAEQTEAMRDWAMANRNRSIARKADWGRTWQGWLRREWGRNGRAPPKDFHRSVDASLEKISRFINESDTERRNEGSEAHVALLSPSQRRDD